MEKGQRFNMNILETVITKDIKINYTLELV